MNKLKNPENFNTSDGNVKDDNIFYKDCCDKFIDYVKKSHNEQDLYRVADTSKTLTEQLKKGELKSGYYFFKTKDNIKIGFLYEGFKHPYDGRYNTIDNILEVLAPVPSYEEYQQLKEYERIVISYNMEPIDYEIACETVNKLLDEKKLYKEENKQLKELLKECKERLIYCTISTQDVQAKINQVLGEE